MSKWAAIFASGGSRRKEREAAARAIRETQEYWLPILEELLREARSERVEDSASFFLLEEEIRRLRRELGVKAGAAPAKLRHPRAREHAAISQNMLERHLALAEEHVARSDRHVAEQRARVAFLEQSGMDCAAARRTLRNFETLRAMHMADLERLRRERLSRAFAAGRKTSQEPRR